MRKTPLTFTELVKQSKGLSRDGQQQAAQAKAASRRMGNLHVVLKRFRQQLGCSMTVLGKTLDQAPRLGCPDCFRTMPVIQADGGFYRICNICERADGLTAEDAATAKAVAAPTTEATATN